MRVKVAVKETAHYEVWLDVDDPDDRNELDAAWTNLDSTVADQGMVGYDDRDFEVIDVETSLDTVRDVQVATLREAADLIQALHPGEVKASVEWLRERADRIERGES